MKDIGGGDSPVLGRRIGSMGTGAARQEAQRAPDGPQEFA